MMAKVNPELWVQLYETAYRSTTGDEHVMANYFPVVVGLVGHQWLVSLPENHIDSWYALHRALLKTSLLPVNSQATSMTFSASVTPGTNHRASTFDASRICASGFLGSLTMRL
jgi:hypothetical protein